MTALRKRFPPVDEILALYATIVFLVYGWVSLTFSWKAPSWLYFLSLGEITAILAYTLVSSLVECTIILSVFLFIGFILPPRLFVDKFIVRGSVVMYLLTFWMMVFNLNTLIQLPTSSDMAFLGLVTCLTVALTIMIADRISSFRKMLIALGNRLIIFLYLWLPLSALGILVIILRILKLD